MQWTLIVVCLALLVQAQSSSAAPESSPAADELAPTVAPSFLSANLLARQRSLPAFGTAARTARAAPGPVPTMTEEASVAMPVFLSADFLQLHQSRGWSLPQPGLDAWPAALEPPAITGQPAEPPARPPKTAPVLEAAESTSPAPFGADLHRIELHRARGWQLPAPASPTYSHAYSRHRRRPRSMRLQQNPSVILHMLSYNK